MPTYFVRHDGTQTSKANALQGGAAARALSVAGFNGETFSAGDEIIFENSGTYTSAATISATGTAALPIIVRGPSATDRPVLQPSTGACFRATGDYIHVKNFQGIGIDDDCFAVGPNSGTAGDGYTVKFYDCLAVSNSADDGFGSASPGSDASKFEFVRCEARAITGAANQGFTCHDNQDLLMTDCVTTSACETAIGVIGNSCTVNGGIFYATADIFYIAQGCIVTVNDADLYATPSSNSAIGDLNDSGSSLYINDCYCEVSATSTGHTDIKATGQVIEFNGGTLKYAGTGTSGFEYTADGTVRFVNGCRIILSGAMGLRFLRNVAGGGVFVVDSCTIDLSAVTGTTTRVIFEARNTSNGLGSALVNSLILGGSPQNCTIVRTADACVATIDIFNNVFDGILATSNACYRTLKTTATGRSRIRNNIFYNCTDAINGSNGVIKDYNVYCGGTPDESDTNGSTSDPVFVDQANDDYRLSSSSPFISNGNGVSGATDRAGLRWSNPPSRGAYQYRAESRPASLSRPAASR